MILYFFLLRPYASRGVTINELDWTFFELSFIFVKTRVQLALQSKVLCCSYAAKSKSNDGI